MSSSPSSFQLTEDQGLFLIQFFTQNAHLLPAQRQDLPTLLSNQRRSRARTASGWTVRLQELERREREVARRERELERRVHDEAANESGRRYRNAENPLGEEDHLDNSNRDASYPNPPNEDSPDEDSPNYRFPHEDLSLEALPHSDLEDHLEDHLEHDLLHRGNAGNAPREDLPSHDKDLPRGDLEHDVVLRGDVAYDNPLGEDLSTAKSVGNAPREELSSHDEDLPHGDIERDVILRGDVAYDNPLGEDLSAAKSFSWNYEYPPSEDEGTLVDSDFTDKWFQAQAEDLEGASVEVWLAEQAEGRGNISSQGNSDSATTATSATSRKRIFLEEEEAPQTQEDEAIEAIVGEGDGGGRGGGGDPGRPAHGCTRNGQSANASKRRKAAHSSLREEEEEEEEAAHNQDQENVSALWAVSDVPAAASQEVRNSATILLLEIGMGEGTRLDSSESVAWIGDLQKAISVCPWADVDSLQGSNLACLTRRLSRLEVVDTGLTFLKIMTELMFASKINSILHHKRLCQKETGQVQKASLRPILGKLIQDQNLKLSTLLRWYSAGSRWGRLASGGTVYFLMVVARKPHLVAKLKGKRVTSTTIIELSNMLRYPQSIQVQEILRDNLVPLLVRLTQEIPLEIPTLFHRKVLKYFQLTKTLDCRVVSESDKYFDLFFQHTAMALPRLHSFWQNLTGQGGGALFSLKPMTSSYLSGSTLALDPSQDSDSEDERDNMGNQSDLPIFVNNFSTEDQVDILFSTFSYKKSSAGKKDPFPKRSDRQSWTDKHRLKAEEGKRVHTLDELSQGVSVLLLDLCINFYPF
ncbi:hypothetical protein FB446DRAFT_785184 [Lentinula raphanica]|nr:hypothetical protein FB446DRAFT_785184 [Lentinula raphanica]